MNIGLALPTGPTTHKQISIHRISASPTVCLRIRQQTTEKKSPQRRGHSSILHSSDRPSLIDDCRTTEAELTTPTNAGNS